MKSKRDLKINLIRKSHKLYRFELLNYAERKCKIVPIENIENSKSCSVCSINCADWDCRIVPNDFIKLCRLGLQNQKEYAIIRTESRQGGLCHEKNC